MKSVLAVLAGLISVVALSIGLDLLMHSSGIFPTHAIDMTTTHWSIATAYRVVVSIFGCWLAARLAPARPMTHALVTGGIGMCIAIAGAIYAWNQGPEFGPHWYPIALVVTALPCAWIGGLLERRKPGA